MLVEPLLHVDRWTGVPAPGLPLGSQFFAEAPPRRFSHDFREELGPHYDHVGVSLYPVPAASAFFRSCQAYLRLLAQAIALAIAVHLYALLASSPYVIRVAPSQLL